MEPLSALLAAIGVIASLTGVWMTVASFYAERRNRERVEKAENEAFVDKPVEIERKLRELVESQADFTERAQITTKLIEDSRMAISMGSLFNLYSKQIEKYQQQTRSRATLSFIFAIVAISAGLGFVFWGGTVMLSGSDKMQLAAGSIISAIGGSVSAYITKTFMDIHRLSLTQLNRYFRQPVINDHILMAQRLAEEVADEESRKKAYEMVIQSITNLINESGNEKTGGEKIKT